MTEVAGMLLRQNAVAGELEKASGRNKSQNKFEPKGKTHTMHYIIAITLT